jgi:hypothetical protein
MKRYLLVITLAVLILSFSNVGAQDPVQPRPSPLELVTMKYEDTYVKITYCRPHKRGRATFGELVPYDEVWRTGANEATEITLTGDIKMGGNLLKAGTYSLFSIPSDEKWTIIINKDLGQWGAFRYNEQNDILRFEANTQETEVIYEPFTIEFEQSGLQKTNLLLIWDKTKVVIPIEFL